MTDIPPELRVSHPLAAWSLRLVRAILRRTIKPGLGYLIHQHSDGFSLEISPGGGFSAVRCFRLKSVPADEDYLIARTWDGTTEGSTDIYIAKNLETRQPATETIAGEVWTYTYSTGADANNQYRTAVKAVYPKVRWWCLIGFVTARPAPRSGRRNVLAALPRTPGCPRNRNKLMVLTARCWAKRA